MKLRERFSEAYRHYPKELVQAALIGFVIGALFVTIGVTL